MFTKIYLLISLASKSECGPLKPFESIPSSMWKQETRQWHILKKNRTEEERNYVVFHDIHVNIIFS